MSMQTDIVFVKALRSNAELVGQLPAGDVYNTSIALPDEDADNAPLPYIIVTFDGLNNQDATKDSEYEGVTDQVQVGIEIAAKTRPQLAAIAEAVRRTVREYFLTHEGDETDEDYALIPQDMVLTAQAVQYDSLKPCYWQVLNYNCTTNV